MFYIIQIIYCLALGYSYKNVFKLSFAQSLAPAFFIHILLCLFTGIVFGSVSLGIWGGIVIALLILLKAVISECKSGKSVRVFLPVLCEQFNDTAFLIFILLFVFIIIANRGKYFVDWDEFSHWGMFLKETLRLDKLYCVSPKDFAHKDYVPLVTMFEAIWCRLSLRFEEADAYRAVQILQFSMILPVAGALDAISGSNEIILKKTRVVNAFNGRKKIDFAAVLISLLKTSVIIVLLLYIFPSPGQNAFHTVYQDIIYAFLIFFCVYAVCSNFFDDKYRVFLVTLSLSILVLVKMTAVFFLPMILCFYLIIYISEHGINKSNIKNIFARCIIIGGIPGIIWVLINFYIKQFTRAGNIQSYGSIKLSSLIDVFTHNGVIKHQNGVDDVFTRALSSQLFGTLSLKKAIVFIVVLILILAVFRRNKKDRKKLLLIDGWYFVTAILYVLMMYFLYCTQFSESEALALTSFDRYMNSIVFAGILIVVYLFYDSISDIAARIKSLYALFTRKKDAGLGKTENVRTVSHKNNIYLYLTFICLTCMSVGLFAYVKFPERFAQLLPGAYGRDTAVYNERMENAAPVLENTNADIDERIFCIICSSDYGEFNTLRYDTNPRTVDGGIIGSKRDDSFGWDWSWEMTKDEFVQEVSKYNYIYFQSVDDVFMDEYSDAFNEPDRINARKLYKVSVETNKIILTE